MANRTYKKKMQIQENWSEGFDLLVERDAGNEVLILTGKPERSLAFWTDLAELCQRAIEELEERIANDQE